MRISADSKNPHYTECAFYCDIKLNGVKINGVVTADTVLGTVVCIDNFDSNPDIYHYKTLKGKVEIIPGPRVEIRGGKLQFAEDM